MDSIRLSKRLGAIAGLVPKGASVIDVGTDHGHIPVFLAQNGVFERIIASDINDGPLASARDSAAEHGALDKIEFVKADGLAIDGIRGIDVVILSGMGGELIASIVDGAKWLKEGQTLLILQPQSKAGHLCSYLAENGYKITDALLVRDSGKLYSVMTARASPRLDRAPSGILTLLSALQDRRDPLLPEFLDEIIARETKAERGRRQAKDYDETSDSDLLLELRRIREGTEKW